MSDEKKKGGGAKTSRSETVTVRLDPRTRYLAEVAARAQRRTLSSFIEEGVRLQVGLTELGLDQGGVSRKLHEVAIALWDVEPVDRFVKLAMNFPHLLDHEEQKLWKLVLETFNVILAGKSFTGSLAEMEVLRRNGGLFQAATNHNFMPSELAKALTGDKEMQQTLAHLHEVSQGPFATEHPDTTKERAALKAAKKAGTARELERAGVTSKKTALK